MVPEVAGRGRILDFFASKQFDYLIFDMLMPITVQNTGLVPGKQGPRAWRLRRKA